MKSLKKDIDEFFKEGEEKPILVKNNKRYIPTDKGYIIVVREKKK